MKHPVVLWNRTFEHANGRSIATGHSAPVEHLAIAISGAGVARSCLATEEAISEIFDTVLEEDAGEIIHRGLDHYSQAVE